MGTPVRRPHPRSFDVTPLWPPLHRRPPNPSPKDGVMPSTNPTTILTRTSHCLAAAALMAGVALAAQPIAGASPEGFSNCVNRSTEIGTFAKCCADYGGTLVDHSSHKTCTFPAPTASQEGSTPPKARITVTQVTPRPAAPEGPGPVIAPMPMAPNRGVG